MKVDDKTGLWNHFSGRLDNVTFYTYRNMKCARMIPERVKAPSAPGQLAQQERMASLATFYRVLKEAGIYTYWQRAAEGMVWNGYNLLVKVNLPAFDGTGCIGDFAKLRLTWGEVALPDGLELRREGQGRKENGEPGGERDTGGGGAEGSGEGTWRLVWRNPQHQANASADDRLLLFLIRDRETFGIQPLETSGACRGDGQAVVRIPPEFREFPHLYVAFRTHTGEKCSMSGYFYLNN